jgi:hypothetical protein
VKFRLLALIPCLLAATACGAPAPRWRDEAPLPRAVAGHAAAWHAGELWIAGGTWWEGELKRIGTTLLHRASGRNLWTETGEIPGGFAHGGFATDTGSLWLAGGLSTAGASADVRRLDLRTGGVTEVARLGGPRVHCGAALLAGSLWVIGGAPSDRDLSQADGAAWQINVATGTVTALPSGPPWINPLVLPLEGRLHVLPGGVWSPERRRLEVPSMMFLFHPAERRWESRSLAVPLPRGLGGAALDDRRAVLAGGVRVREGGTEITGETWLYHASRGTFAPLPPLPGPRLAAAFLRAGEDVLVLGGEDQPRGRTVTAWRLAGGKIP